MEKEDKLAAVGMLMILGLAAAALLASVAIGIFLGAGFGFLAASAFLAAGVVVFARLAKSSIGGEK